MTPLREQIQKALAIERLCARLAKELEARAKSYSGHDRRLEGVAEPFATAIYARLQDAIERGEL
jgi:chromosome segregation and condensation protein ScpB